MNNLGSLMLVFFITLAEVSEGQKDTLTTTTVAPVIPKGQDPLVHYQCKNSTGSYEITISMKGNKTLNYYAITHKKGNFNINNTADKCEKEFNDRPATGTVKLTECKQDTLYLYIMPRPAYVTPPPSGGSNMKPPIIAGGKSFHEYEINCKVQANGTLYNLTKNFNDTETGQKGKTKENPDLKLTLSITNPSTIFIGDKVTLTVTDTTDIKNYLKFTDCVASDAKHGDISSITLIKNGTAIEKDIISSVHNSSTLGNNSVEFYAFRFATSSEVKIICSIRACPTKDCTAPTTTTSTTTPTPKTTTTKQRRRRSVNNELNSDSRTVSVTFEVHDKKESSGGIKVGHVSPLLLAAIVFGWMKLL